MTGVMLNPPDRGRGKDRGNAVSSGRVGVMTGVMQKRIRRSYFRILSYKFDHYS